VRVIASTFSIEEGGGVQLPTVPGANTFN